MHLRARQSLYVLLTLLFAHAATGAAEAVMLVDDGEPNAVLIVEADAPKAQRAAEALQTYIEKMSGATLPLVTEGDDLPDDAPPVRVHVGHTSVAAGQDVPAGIDPSVRDEAFEEEGYVLRTIDEQTLLVAGNNDGPYRGTIFAAFALLEELGCRFYFPGEWGEVVPESATVTVPSLDVVSRPDFAVRYTGLSGWIPKTRDEEAIYAEWSHRVGFSERLYPVAGDGFLALLLPPGEFFEEHPEYYAMNRSGERHVGRTDRHTMLCLSNPEVYDEIANNLRRDYAEGRREHGVGISPPDGTPYCFCEDCQAQSQNFQYPRYAEINQPLQSEEYFSFAARLAREFPDKWMSTMAYSLREMPPQGVDMPSNMVVTYAPITADVLHPGDTHLWRRSQFMDMLAQYREQTPHVQIYDYNPGFLTGLFVPERDVANMAVNAPLYRDLDLKGMTREGRKAFMQTWISYYISAKLLWDADADVEALKQDFYTTFFGPEAGPHVQAWWDACEQVLGESNMQVHEDFLVNNLYTVEFTDRIHEHVEAALAAPATDVQRERVQAFALIAENLEQFAAMHDAERRMDWPAAAAAAGRMVELKDELHAIYSFFISPDNRMRRFFAEGRQQTFEQLAAMTDGTTGRLVAELPLEMRFRRDPFNEGIITRWYRDGHDDSDWEMRDTYFFLEQQEEPLDERGFHYDGYVWYRTTFDVPAEFDGEPVSLRLNGIVNEGWVWLNGEYVSHHPYRMWWRAGHESTFDVSDLVRPGEQNTLTVRVLNHPDEVGGLYRRGFLYSPLEVPEDEAAASAE